MRLLAALLMICATTLVGAAEPEIYQAEASGQLVIEPDGTVSSFKVNESLGEDVDPVIRQRISAWRFEPVKVDDKAVRARAYFELTLQAQFGSERSGELRIVRAQFLDPPGEGSTSFTKNVVAPRYPRVALESRIGGELTLLVKINEHGKVVETSGQNGWLSGRAHTLGERKQKLMMDAFVHASDKAISQWDFSEAAAKGMRFFAVPITYSLNQKAPWRRIQRIAYEKELWTAEMDAQPMGQLGAGGKKLRTDIQLLDALDPEESPEG